ncbi:MAG: MFS transporter [Bauldia sp.]|nr:MFS transporter [Bauldia sp.]
MASPASPESLDPHASRTVWLLTTSFALVGLAPLVVVTLGGLAGEDLLGADKSLATLPVAGYNVGQALFAIPAARLAERLGRRAGLMSGGSIIVAGSLLAMGALLLSSFWLFAAALLLIGCAGSFAQQHRFAAIETVPAAHRGLAISRVLIGGLAVAAVGPPVILATRDLFSPGLPFAGAFIALIAVALLSLVVLRRLSLAPPRTATGAVGPDARPLSVIARQPRFLIALLCAAASYALMAMVMTAAPLAMVEHHHHSQSDAVLGIQWHVLAMFAPSLVTGRLIARYGKELITAVGLGLLFVSALVGIAGTAVLHFWAMLIVLGVGWNFGFVGATALLAETYTSAERGRVEGFNDFVVFGTMAAASLLSGELLDSAGWTGVNITVLPIVATVLALLLFLVMRQRRQPA